MLSVFAVILQHPLACLAFALWHLIAPWGEGGHDLIRSTLDRLGYEDLDFDDVWTPHAKRTAPNKFENAADPPEEELHAAPAVKAAFTAPAMLTAMKVSDPMEKPDRFADCDNMDWIQQHVGKWHITRSKNARLPLVCETPATKCHPGLQTGCTTGKECPSGFIWDNADSCFAFRPETRLKFRCASNACSKHGAHLPTPDSKAKNDFLQELVGQESVWLGLWWSSSHDDPMKFVNHEVNHGSWHGWGSSNLTYTNWDEHHNPNKEEYDHDAPHVYMNYWKDLCMPPPYSFFHPSLTVALIFFGIAAVCGIVSMCIPVIYTCFYKRSVTNQRQPLAEEPNQQQILAPKFRFGLCSWCEDLNICMHACFCTTVRAADTHDAAGSEKFWTVILYWFISIVAGSVLGGGAGNSISGIIMAIIMAQKRQALRQKMGIAPSSSLEDFLLWWCCTPCVVAQEAREVDHKAGVSVHCCCSLRQVHPPVYPMVGPPVVAAAPSISPANPQIVSIQPPPPFQQMQIQQPMAEAVPQVQYVFNPTPATPPIQQHALPTVAQVVHIQPPTSDAATAWSR